MEKTSESIIPDEFNPMLTSEERRLIWLMRNRFQYGTLTVNVRNGNPYRIEHVQSGYMLSEQ